jgi:tRNA A-37 threonylcarbamoyl transferase component Bud32
MYRRLGGVALVYAAAWIANFLYFNLLPLETGFPDRRMFFYVSTALCSLLGIAVYWGCRTRRIPPRHFANFAVVFEVMAGFGIMAGLFGWEHHGEQFIIRIAGALGFDGGASEVVSRLRSEGMRVIYSDGVSWVSVWLLVFPLIVPAPLGRTVVATLLTASTIPAVALLSLAVNGIPPAVRPWLLPYALELIVPTYICAGIAIFGSRVVYKLTRDLSKARQMGSYQLLEKIGAGGMGEVWKAKHQMLVRPAAIKFIRPEALGADNAASRTALRRFEREAQATSGLASPHSIDLYDFGVTDDGTFYFVMELLEGVDLKKLIEQFGPMPAERAVHILRQACHSLADAHSQGIVHRDIKPGNIFVARSGLEYDFVKVLDFGLVKHLYATETDTAHLTIEGVASGTPGFMAPEIASDHRRVDARADLYALGCVAYWILTGKLVFEGESAMAILVRHVKGRSGTAVRAHDGRDSRRARSPGAAVPAQEPGRSGRRALASSASRSPPAPRRCRPGQKSVPLLGGKRICHSSTRHRGDREVPV